MAEIKVDLGPGLEETWTDWVMPGGKAEYDGLPPSLQVPLRSLARRPGTLTPPDKLLEYYDNIEALTRDPATHVTDADVAPYLTKIGDRVRDLTARERKAALRELPLYFGAVFRGGRNEVLVEDPQLIPILDVRKKNDREAFILENIHAFDYLFKNPAAWKQAVDFWITDFDVATTKARLEPEIVDKFYEKLKAMMGVTASARAMEASSGAATNYLVILTGGEKGNLDMQDQWSTYLVHNDPEKLNRVINDPLVKRYYNKLMEDAGLKIGPNNDNEWRKVKDGWQPSQLEFARDLDDIRKGPLVEYLKKEADKGGFEKYITEVLLKIDSPREVAGLESLGYKEDARLAAAQLACDVFLIDKWTRWENKIADANLKLQPAKDWGGDPLRSVLEPAYLPRLKKVYTGKDELILKLTDKTFRPDDLLTGELSKYLITSSMAIHLKKYARLSDAMFQFLGGSSMSTGIPSWNREILEKNLPQIADLLTQVYGTITTKNPDGSEKQVGKHLVGAIMMRLLYTKALAATLESAKPGFGSKLEILFQPQAETRPFLDVMRYLYGPKLDTKSGFIQSLVGGRTRLVIKGNMFDAEKFYKETWELLVTNDQTGGRKQAQALNRVGFSLDVAQGIARNLGIMGKR